MEGNRGDHFSHKRASSQARPKDVNVNLKGSVPLLGSQRSSSMWTVLRNCSGTRKGGVACHGAQGRKDRVRAVTRAESGAWWEGDLPEVDVGEEKQQHQGGHDQPAMDELDNRNAQNGHRPQLPGTGAQASGISAGLLHDHAGGTEWPL